MFARSIPGAQAVHLYGQNGTFAATVRVRDSRGLLSLASAPVSISVAGANAAPIAALAATPLSGRVPLQVGFDASGSSDPDSGDSVASFTLAFGDGTPSVTQGTPAFSHTYTAPGTYQASLTVVDSRGLASAGAATRTIVVTPTTVPQAPTIGAATPADGAASIAFSPPADNGGAAITSYTVTCSPGSHTATGTASPIVVGGLANGTPYSCTVTATNAAGTSAPSGTVSVTPAGGATPGDALFSNGFEG
jgi:large repetitive protein